MEKLKSLSREDLENKYYNEFGLPADHHPTDTIIAAIYFGKRINSLTAEEIDSVEHD